MRSICGRPVCPLSSFAPHPVLVFGWWLALILGGQSCSLHFTHFGISWGIGSRDGSKHFLFCGFTFQAYLSFPLCWFIPLLFSFSQPFFVFFLTPFSFFAFSVCLLNITLSLPFHHLICFFEFFQLLIWLVCSWSAVGRLSGAEGLWGLSVFDIWKPGFLTSVRCKRCGRCQVRSQGVIWTSLEFLLSI